MAITTRTEKYRKYRASILKMSDLATTEVEIAEHTNEQTTYTQPDEGIHKSTTSIPLSEIIKATGEFGSQEEDTSMIDKYSNRRFIIKVIIACLSAIALIVIGVLIYIELGGR